MEDMGERELKTLFRYRRDDRTKCQTVVDKILPFVRENGSKEKVGFYGVPGVGEKLNVVIAQASPTNVASRRPNI